MFVRWAAEGARPGSLLRQAVGEASAAPRDVGVTTSHRFQRSQGGSERVGDGTSRGKGAGPGETPVPGCGPAAVAPGGGGFGFPKVGRKAGVTPVRSTMSAIIRVIF